MVREVSTGLTKLSQKNVTSLPGMGRRLPKVVSLTARQTLSLLLSHPEQSFYVREIGRKMS